MKDYGTVRIMKKVKDFKITKSRDSDEILEQMEELGGFQGNKVAKAVNILERMIKDEKSLNFLAFPACLVATGIRGVLREMVKRNWFDFSYTSLNYMIWNCHHWLVPNRDIVPIIVLSISIWTGRIIIVKIHNFFYRS